VKGPRPLLVAWAFLVLGLAIRAFAAGVLAPHQPAAVAVAAVAIDVNRASVDELMVLPGIGRTRAEAIVVARIRAGPFRSMADLERVEGLGPTTVRAFRDMVTFSATAAIVARDGDNR
jgi:competence protein ComEA